MDFPPQPPKQSTLTSLTNYFNSEIFSLSTPLPSLTTLSTGVTLWSILSSIDTTPEKLYFPAVEDSDLVSTNDLDGDWQLKLSNLKKLVSALKEFYNDVLLLDISQTLDSLDLPSISLHSNLPGIVELCEIVILALIASEFKNDYITAIMTLKKEEQGELKGCIERGMGMVSVESLEGREGVAYFDEGGREGEDGDDDDDDDDEFHERDYSLSSTNSTLTADITQVTNENKSIKTQIHKLQKNFKELESKLSLKESEHFEETLGHNEKLQGLVFDLQVRLEQSEVSDASHEGEVKKMKAKVEQNESKYRELEQLNKELTEEIESIKVKHLETKKSKVKAESTATKLTKKNEELENCVSSELENKLSTSEQLSVALKRNEGLEDECNFLRNKIETTEATCASVTTELKHLATTSSEVSSKYNKVSLQNKQLLDENDLLKVARVEVVRLEALNGKLSSKVKDSDVRCDVLQREIISINSNGVRSEEARFDALKSENVGLVEKLKESERSHDERVLVLQLGKAELENESKEMKRVHEGMVVGLEDEISRGKAMLGELDGEITGLKASNNEEARAAAVENAALQSKLEANERIGSEASSRAAVEIATLKSKLLSESSEKASEKVLELEIELKKMKRVHEGTVVGLEDEISRGKAMLGELDGEITGLKASNNEEARAAAVENAALQSKLEANERIGSEASSRAAVEIAALKSKSKASDELVEGLRLNETDKENDSKVIIGLKSNVEVLEEKLGKSIEVIESLRLKEVESEKVMERLRVKDTEAALVAVESKKLIERLKLNEVSRKISGVDVEIGKVVESQKKLERKRASEAAEGNGGDDDDDKKMLEFRIKVESIKSQLDQSDVNGNLEAKELLLIGEAEVARLKAMEGEISSRFKTYAVEVEMLRDALGKCEGGEGEGKGEGARVVNGAAASDREARVKPPPRKKNQSAATIFMLPFMYRT